MSDIIAMQWFRFASSRITSYQAFPQNSVNPLSCLHTGHAIGETTNQYRASSDDKKAHHDSVPSASESQPLNS